MDLFGRCGNRLLLGSRRLLCPPFMDLRCGRGFPCWMGTSHAKEDHSLIGIRCSPALGELLAEGTPLEVFVGQF